MSPRKPPPRKAATALAAHPVQDAVLEGLQVIEASAGTGKTWTLCGLYLRLLLERDAKVDQILAITFTIAAAAELRDRIRARIAQALAALEGREPGDELIDWLLARIDDKARARRQLALALHSFDEARIHTIHGYCQRALADHAFASGVAFRCELMADTSEVLHEVAADFWRSRLASVPAAGSDPRAQRLLVEWLRSQGAGVKALEKLGLRYARRERLRILRPAATGALDAQLRAFGEAFARARELWVREGATVVEWLRSTTDLKRSLYRKDFFDKMAGEVEAYFADAEGEVEAPKRLERFGARVLAENLKVPLPKRPLFEAVDAVVAASAAALQSLQALWIHAQLDFLDYARTEIARRLGARDLQSFDDLLLKLDQALAAPGGPALGAALRRRCPYALIDEFQDTDPLQWGIFRSLYKDAGPGHAAFLVGDPKQAIYSFRGADVHAYLSAVEEAPEPLRLLRNQRSVEGLVKGLNVLFGTTGNAFRHERIRYEPVVAGREQAPLVEDGKPDATPLRIAVLGATDEGKPQSKEVARDWAAKLVADEILRLLASSRAGQLRLGDRPLRAGDLAVLVNTNRQAAQMRQALAQRGISCAELSTHSVFGSMEAEQLQRLLTAMATPKDPGAVRAALLTDLVGRTANDLFLLEAEEGRWEDELEHFGRLHESWRAHGVMRALREAFRTWQSHGRLAQFRDGERRLTNLYHLCELLNLEEQRLHGIESVVAWLAGRRDTVPTEDMQLRLESDADLVQVVTIHRSKGLEYPVTFVPFLWDGGLRADKHKGMVEYHEPPPSHAQVLDAQHPDDHLPQAREEELGERLRVAYVGLTRGKNRCYVLTGAIRDAETSAMGWLLHGAAIDVKAKLPDEATLRAQVSQLFRDADGAAGPFERAAAAPAVGELPLPPRLQVREPQRRVAEGYALTSFTGLLRSTEALQDLETEPLPDHDQAAAFAAAREVEPGGGRFAFPRGASAGTCLHAILEHVDFAAADWSAVVRSQLAQAGYPGAWAADAEAWLRETVLTPMAGEGSASFRLADVPAAAQVRELPFQLATPAFVPQQLVEVARRHGVPMSDLPSARLPGYLSGYMDLAFVQGGRWYVADHKSNWLGADREAYGPEALATAMAESDYHLQYLLYTVALHRWLRTWQPGYDYDRHFGGVRYLFLRGMHPQGGGAGVFAARPERALVEALDECLGATVREDLAA